MKTKTDIQTKSMTLDGETWIRISRVVEAGKPARLEFSVEGMSDQAVFHIGDTLMAYTKGFLDAKNVKGEYSFSKTYPEHGPLQVITFTPVAAFSLMPSRSSVELYEALSKKIESEWLPHLRETMKPTKPKPIVGLDSNRFQRLLSSVSSGKPFSRN